MKFLSKVTEQKGIVARVGTLSGGSGTLTPNCDDYDIVTITLTGSSATIGAPSGTPTDGQTLILRVVQDGTGGRTIDNWDSAYSFPGGLEPDLHSGAGRVDLFEFLYRSASSTWDCINRDLDLTGQVVGRNTRNTSTVLAVPTSLGVVMTTSAFIRPGRLYRVQAYGEISISSSNQQAIVELHLRYTTNGFTPGTGSTLMGRASRVIRGATFGGITNTVTVTSYYASTIHGTLKVALCAAEVNETAASSLTWRTELAGGYSPLFLTIEDVGPAISDASA